jgi:signal peptidase II
MKKRFIIPVILVVLDQATKFLFQGKYYPLNSFLSISYTKNTGIAFSLFQGMNWLFILISFIALGLVIYYYKLYPLAMSFLIAGITGNLIDRVFLGAVRDFISVSIWPVFNVADACSTIGITILIYNLIKQDL